MVDHAAQRTAIEARLAPKSLSFNWYLEEMLHSLNQRFNRWRFDQACRAIARTPPLSIRPAPLTFVSMVSSRDLFMYLVAIKSLYRRIGEGSIVVLDDGSLSPADHTLLRQQLGNPTIRPISEIDTAPCPRGGTWERLAAIMELSESSFVIQVDSDTITVGDVDEVVESYKANRSFTLGTSMGQTITSMPEAARLVSDRDGDHIQILAEKSFAMYPESEEMRYVRGCSGFAGFAAGAFSRERLQNFSVNMETLVGEKWHEWGSEQVASNFLIANAPNARVLPFPKYTSVHPSLDPNQSAFLHFIGSYRFDGDIYRDLAKKFVDETRSPI